MKSISIVELRKIVRGILKEAFIDDEDPAKARTHPAPATHAQAVAKTHPAPRQTVGARDIDQLIQKQDKPTVPAKMSNAERSMDQEFKTKQRNTTGAPGIPPIPITKTPANQKLAMVARVLGNKGISVDHGALQSWISNLDPDDVVVKPSEQLASEFWVSQQGSKR